ncbi:hypothetical protein BH18ACI3_BH18ACI3_12050 [soil metagenome]
MVEIGTLLQDRYLIEKQIGRGGMGAVFIAVDQKFGSRVAIKETFYQDSELGEAFEREARLLNSLHHPILPHVSDYFSEGGVYFLVMEYIEGEDLSEILERDGAFPVSDVIHWASGILDGLDYLHSQEPPIIHRDIKPNNLKLTSRRNIILLDFGLAKETTGDTQSMRSIFGYSKRYSPLEQIEGTGTDARSDIFSLGATLFHLLTGKPAIDVLARASAIVSGKPDPLRLASEVNEKVPLAFADLLNSSLALNADRRFVSANAMRKALEQVLASGAQLENAETYEEVFADSGTLVPVSAVVESFPALQAFKAEMEQPKPEIRHYDTVLVDTSLSNGPVQLEISNQSHASSKGMIIENRQSNARMRTVAMAAVIFACLLTASYGIYNWKSKDNAAETSVGESNSPPIAAEQTRDPAPAPPVIPPSVEKVRSKITPAKSRVPVEEEAKPAEPEKTEKAEIPAKPVVPAARSRNTPAQRVNRRASGRSAERQPPVASIENIFVGVPSESLREARRQCRQERLWEEEQDETLRRSREIRRENRRRNFPY